MRPTSGVTSGAWTTYARALRRDVEREAALYRVRRLYQPEGSPDWEVEVEHRPTRERFVLRNEWEWPARVARDAGY